MNNDRLYLRKRIYKSTVAIILVLAMMLSSVPQAVEGSSLIKPVNSTTNSSSLGQTSRAGKNNFVTVSSQYELYKALADKNITYITISTPEELKITIPSGVYQTKVLNINGPKLTVINNGIFQSIIISNAKTFTENAKGNYIRVNDKALNLNISKTAAPKEVIFAREGTRTKIKNDGIINRLMISDRAVLTFTGSTRHKTPILINNKGANSKITSSIPIIVNSEVDATINLNNGAEKSDITLGQSTSSITVVNKTRENISVATPDGKEIVKVGKTLTTKKQEKPTQAPEEGDKELAPTPTVKPDTSSPGDSNNGGTINIYTLTFDSQGGNAVEDVKVVKGKTIENIPTPHKNNSVFLGWYTDSSYQNEFTETTAVYSNLTLYAKYSEIEIEQLVLDDSFALAEQSPSLSFVIMSTDSTMTVDGVRDGLILERMDDTEIEELVISGSKGIYHVSTLNGFTEGASYVLTLRDSRLNFQDKETTIRKCSFNIEKDEIYNISLNDDIIYIPSTQVANMTQNGLATQALSVAVVSMNMEESDSDTTNGTFTYHGNRLLMVGDVLCIYSGDLPQAPGVNEDDSDYMDDSIAYLTVDSVSGEVGDQAVQYSDADSEEVLFIPDVLPFFVGNGNKLTSHSLATSSSDGRIELAMTNLDFSAFYEMGLSSETTIDAGDFLALYSEDFTNESSSDTVIYGEVTEVIHEDGLIIIDYTSSSYDDMQEALDYYSKNDLDSDIMLDDVDLASLEEEIEEQVIESGFAEDASIYLTALAMETESFQNVVGDDFILESMSVTVEDGSEVDLDAMSIMSMSSKVSIENLKVKASIGTNLKKLSGKGVRCGVTVSFDVPIETGDDSAIVISISATFVEEVKLEVNASGNAVWKKKWIFPYIADYKMNANLDLYNYTGISFKAIVSTANTGSTDISEEIQNILSYSASEEITAGVQDLFEIYGDMMENEADWVDIFSQNIVKVDVRLLLGVIHIRTTVDFVVSANVNVALGCNFEYQSGTRYIFWATLKAREAGSSQIDLMDEKYTFQFYVMGTLGLRAGVRLEVAVGLLSVNLNSVGLTAEAGIYTRLYGYFFYHLESVNKVKNSKMSGAMYLDFGIYLEIAFKAQVLNGKYQYNPTLYAKEWPLLSAGSRYNVYDFADDHSIKMIKMKDQVRTYTLPDSTFKMTYLDLKEGNISTKAYKVTDYNITFSNKNNFSLSGKNIKVNVPEGVHKLESDMTVTWKGGPLAFSSLPISRTYHIVWDNINDDGYSITFESNGGSPINNMTVKYDKIIAKPSDPIRDGYIFEGWYSDEKLTTAFVFDKMKAKDIILYAKWTASSNTKYQVEHYQQNLVNDGYTKVDTDVLEGRTDETVMASIKNYAGFTYNSEVKDTLNTGIIAADGSLVLKLYYNRNSYNLTFRTNNGGSDIVNNLKYGARISAPTVINKGYTFTMWDQPVLNIMPARDLLYTAVWMPDNYTIRLNTNGGSSMNNIIQAYGSYVSEPLAPLKEGHEFAGWYLDEMFTIPYTFTTMPSENITIYAKWEVKEKLDSYQVEHYLQNIKDDGYTLQETENLEGTLDDTVNAVSKLYRGFTYNSGVEDTILSGNIVEDGGLVLKLYYDRNSYSLTFRPENGEEDIISRVKFGAGIQIPQFEKNGHSFGEWDQTIVDIMPAQDMIYTAKWNVNQYTIHFETKGGSSIESISQDYGSIVSEPLYPSKDGYEFMGWYLDEALTEAYVFTTMPSIDFTLYAKWDVEAEAKYFYHVYHYIPTADRSTYYVDSVMRYEVEPNSIVTIETKYYPGRTLRKELDGADLNKTISNTAMSFSLYYDNNTYSITFRPENGEEDITRSMYYLESIVYPEFTKEGYTHGWDQYNYNMPAQDMVYTAVWTPAYYIIKFNTNGGDYLSDINQAYGTAITKKPTRLGYLFDGWYVDEALTEAYTSLTVPANDMTLHAKWVVDETYFVNYYVTYYHQNKYDDRYSFYSQERLQANMGELVTADIKTFTGFTFNGEVEGSKLTDTIDYYDNANLEVYYDRNSYSVTFKPDNGEADIIRSFRYGTEVIYPDVKKTGFILTGWGEYSYIYEMMAEDIVCTAQWSLNTGMIEFNTNGGSYIPSIYEYYGTSISQPQDPTRVGYTFGGWYMDEGFTVPYTFTTMPDVKIILYAKWDGMIVNGDILEAENATIYGYRTSSEWSANASGGLQVGFIERAGDGVRFEQMRSTDEIYIRYASIETGTMSIYINGEKRGDIYLIASGDYVSYYNVAKITGLNLSSGDSLSFQYDGDSDNVVVNIDYIAYSLDSNTAITSEITLQ